MSYSPVSISNLALATIGETAIRDFNEDNKRARMCQTFFVPTRDYLLSKFDWPFARKFAKLNVAILPEDARIEGYSYYGLPQDYLVARDLHPRNGRNSWEIMGEYLVTFQPVQGLYYTSQISDTARFSDGFVNLLALGMSVRLAPVLTSDKALAKALYTQYQREQVNTWESEANVGNAYRHPDNDPNLDTFVNVEGERLPYCTVLEQTNS